MATNTAALNQFMRRLLSGDALPAVLDLKALDAIARHVLDALLAQEADVAG